MKNKDAFWGIRVFPGLVALLGMMLVWSCNNEDDPNEFPITNDFRVLQVRQDGNIISSGVADISVIPQLELVCSHPINASSFESALSVEPQAEFSVSYDASGSFATVSFDPPLDYETAYTLTLPAGTYGSSGQASTESFSFQFLTAPFQPAAVTLTASEGELFEGGTITVTAQLDMAILQEVSMDLEFGGDAENGVDYDVSSTTIVIAPGETAASVSLSGLVDGDLEGAETITVGLTNLVNCTENGPQELTITLGDQPPALELKGVMELDNYIDGSGGRVRAIHLQVLEDIPNLGVYGVEIASNGAAPDPNDIDFVFPDGVSASAGAQLFVVRDADEADAAAYFGDCYADFTVFPSDAITQNGDDAILLYNNGVAIESFGEPGIDGTDTYWEYTDSWACKVGGEWVYAGVGCVVNETGAATDATSTCKYPWCNPVQLQGVSALLWDGSGTNGGKFVHVRINRDVADLSRYSLGVANNGGGTDGIEYTFPSESASEGDHILVAREPGTIAAYLGACYDAYKTVYQADAMTQNGDDAIELFDLTDVIETFGDANVDGTGQAWEYAGSWAYKNGGIWGTASVDCAAGSTSTQASACPYAFCD